MSVRIGLDIGYSNLKVSVGELGENNEIINLKSKIYPAGAAPVSSLPWIEGAAGDGFEVMVDGEFWGAGIEASKIAGFERELHADYPASKPYKALFYAALISAETAVVDKLVTGLPVDQFLDPELRNDLKNRLEGEHQVAPKRTVTVKEVEVVPQPAGSFFAYGEEFNGNEEEIEAIFEGRTLVLDPGFFSFDWTTFQEGELNRQASSMSLKAMSMLLEQVSKDIRRDQGATVTVDKLERAIREGKSKILVAGERVELNSYIEKAKEVVPHNALIPLRKSLRDLGDDVDAVIISGGGASCYLDAAKEVFGESRVFVTENPELANSRGFLYRAA